ncbi:hypothetical protein GGS26DRAFT_601054 [Hypomontagnella submonticulosa]|nr:hypothetical protein GGS26DRAFT_601054 [Hypomontagnella submonticulosa]
MRPWLYVWPFIVYWAGEASRTQAYAVFLQILAGIWTLTRGYSLWLWRPIRDGMEPYLIFAGHVANILRAVYAMIHPVLFVLNINETMTDTFMSLYPLVLPILRVLFRAASDETHRLTPMALQMGSFLLNATALVLYLSCLFGEPSYIPIEERSWYSFFQEVKEIRQPGPLRWAESAVISDYFDDLGSTSRTTYRYTHDGEVVKAGYWTYEEGSSDMKASPV